MPHLSALTDELVRNETAAAAMAILERALACRSPAEQGAFWHAIDLAYVSRKAPPEATGTASPAACDEASVPPG